MTRICSWCGAVIGEKCANCGGAVVLIGDGLYKCEPCGRTFEAGDGGRTDTICDRCRVHPPAA